MLKLGFVSAILADFGFEHVVQFASNNGFDCVEMMCWPKKSDDFRRYAGVCHIDVEHIDVHYIQTYLSDHKVSISGLGYYPIH